MRRKMILSSVGAIAALSALVLHGQAGPTEPPPKTSSAHAIAFDVSGKNTAGADTVLDLAELELRNTAGEVVGRAEAPPVVGVTSIPVAELLEGRAPGLYTVTARVRGANGLWSASTAPFAIDHDPSPPEPPANLRRERITVTVIVEVENP